MKTFALFLAIAWLASCGQRDETVYEPSPSDDPDWVRVSAIVKTDCGGCHNGVKEPAFSSSAILKASPAAAKLKSGQMPPPPRTISDADKAAILAYLGG